MLRFGWGGRIRIFTLLFIKPEAFFSIREALLRTGSNLCALSRVLKSPEHCYISSVIKRLLIFCFLTITFPLTKIREDPTLMTSQLYVSSLSLGSPLQSHRIDFPVNLRGSSAQTELILAADVDQVTAKLLRIRRGCKYRSLIQF